MADLIINEEVLTKRLSGLSVRHQVAFAASCCERLLPDYEAFVLHDGWGDYKTLRHALNEIWRFASGASFPSDYLRNLLDSCEACIYDSEDFPSVFAGLGRNAGAAVYHALEFCTNHDMRLVIRGARLPLDSLDLYLSFVGDPDPGSYAPHPGLDDWISDSPLLKSELNKQQSDLELLTRHLTIDTQLLDELRRSSARLGIQSIARGLVNAPKIRD